MVKARKIQTLEYAILILLWAVVLVSPLLFMDDFDQDMMAVHVMWAECAVMITAFAVNRFALMPRFFFAKKYLQYVASLVGLFVVIGIFVVYFDGVNMILSLFGANPDGAAMPPMMGAGGAPRGMPPQDMPLVDMALQANRPRALPPAMTVIPPAVSVLMLTAIVIALDMGLSIAMRWIISEQKQAEINRERVTAQLANLQSQVSPHFFMNTLNNIHALVDRDSQLAKQTIIELSSLMSYLLYDSSVHEKVPLHRELEFVTSYVNLMRLRYSKHVRIDLSYSDGAPSVKVPPLLFLNFIENAFKYGVDYERSSFVEIDFKFGFNAIEMTVVNSNHSLSTKSERHGGLGISNARKRLDLLYGDKYALIISDDTNTFYVNLKIPML